MLGASAICGRLGRGRMGSEDCCVNRRRLRAWLRRVVCVRCWGREDGWERGWSVSGRVAMFGE